MAESAARLLQLLSLLTSRPQWTAVDLAERLEVTDRTLRRDIERLRALGYPVHSARGVAGGYRLGAGRVLPPLLLDDEEATAVVIALRTAIVGVTGIAETAVSALAKLEQVLPVRLRHRIASLQQATVLLPRAAAMADPQTLTLLAAACYHQHRVRFAYTDRHARPSTRSVEPHRLVHSGRYWYLVARPGPCRLAGLPSRQDHRSARHRCPVHPARPARCRRTRRGCRDDRTVPPPRQSPAAHQRRRRGAHFPPSTGALEATGPGQCVLTTGAYSLDDIAMHLGVLDIEFTVLEPAELGSRVEAITGRFHRAAQRAAEATVP
jgi:biotin operon repressor